MSVPKVRETKTLDSMTKQYITAGVYNLLQAKLSRDAVICYLIC